MTIPTSIHTQIFISPPRSRATAAAIRHCLHHEKCVERNLFFLHVICKQFVLSDSKSSMHTLHTTGANSSILSRSNAFARIINGMSPDYKRNRTPYCQRANDMLLASWNDVI